ncbi:hypothetical protein COT62_02955 [Candidatus Roizmanbacteria bacterium CG09_land_8_20_14_0_10_41_9]|uniref:Metallo-beta-lactamase domain-containing protein n=1 Tax=Candidatus Roizmanbacteria bacterium CG09_land_8_20_14_0_10_41_9 TaxID=1974850 RepID=A0A2H0WSE7_9BACT|nr:MAG: hypothetical protein COT62_02955 [Candidatus Roizmanbacteria bacterium CG09_land_8_20_14_0_10_41_9]
MSSTFITRQHLLFAMGISLASLVISSLIITPRATTVVFCDVGQADGAYIRTKDGIDIVIDAGPNNQMLSCIGKYMPFYDRRIELAILSHPQRDHMQGFFALFDRYQIPVFLTARKQTISVGFQNLLKKIRSSHTDIRFLSSGYKITLSPESALIFIWPEGIDTVPEKTDDNYYSLIFFFEESGFKVLFTGDATAIALRESSQKSNMKADVLKVPHHGSKNGLTRQFLSLTDPDVSVISVGKNNSYGHPSKETLDLLKALGKKYRRTDEQGDIVIEIQNSKLKVKN